MQQRHRIPTIFSVYMVDVLCCALGCVILLWLLNFREAKNRASAASESSKRLSETRGVLDRTAAEAGNLRAALAGLRVRESALLAQLDDSSRLRGELQALLQDTQHDRDQKAKALVLSRAQLESLRADLKKLEALNTETSAALATKTRERDDLTKRMAVADLRIRSLEKDLGARTQDHKTATARVEDLSALLKQAEARLLKLETQVAGLRLEGKDFRAKLDVSGVRARLLEEEVAKYKEALALADRRYEDLLAEQDKLSKRLAAGDKDLVRARALIAALEGERTTLNASVKTLQGERETLLERSREIQAAAEKRFAGITLTGKRVLFLVDMSGSMELTDEKTFDPDKWPFVAATLARIMGSLPNLEKYQVILFSERLRYPLGSPGRWLDYDANVSLKGATNAVRAVKPVGETNMSAAFEEAFRFRQEGLDTIYVLSDGLPNAGEGLPPDADKLTPVQKSDYLSRYVRQRLKVVLNPSLPSWPRVRINTVGFFFESPEVGAFLWALARENEGSFVGMNR